MRPTRHVHITEATSATAKTLVGASNNTAQAMIRLQAFRLVGVQMVDKPAANFYGDDYRHYRWSTVMGLFPEHEPQSFFHLGESTPMLRESFRDAQLARAKYILSIRN